MVVITSASLGARMDGFAVIEQQLQVGVQGTAIPVKNELFSQSQRAKQSVDLTESVLLPLFGGAVTEDLSVLNETPNAGWAISLNSIELLRDVPIASHTAFMGEDGPTRQGQRVDSVCPESGQFPPGQS